MLWCQVSNNLSILSNHPAILGENNSNLPRIVAVITETLARNAIEITSPFGQQIVSFLRSLQQNAPILEHCVNVLTQEQRLALTQVLTT